MEPCVVNLLGMKLDESGIILPKIRNLGYMWNLDSFVLSMLVMFCERNVVVWLIYENGLKLWYTLNFRTGENTQDIA